MLAPGGAVSCSDSPKHPGQYHLDLRECWPDQCCGSVVVRGLQVPFVYQLPRYDAAVVRIDNPISGNAKTFVKPMFEVSIAIA